MLQEFNYILLHYNNIITLLYYVSDIITLPYGNYVSTDECNNCLDN